MYQQILNWASEIIQVNSEIIGLASLRRSKFEGWLKFELARKLYQNEATEIHIEESHGNGLKCDLSFLFNNKKWFIELKTPNTSWKIPGIANLVRPVKLNRESIIKDVYKFRKNNIANGIICFVLFPIPQNNNRWQNYIEIISQRIKQRINFKNSCKLLPVGPHPFNPHPFNVVICCFRVKKKYLKQ
ncbi:MAG: hypothetical protein ABR980_06520 [Ignavibacteriaceae bacterium]|jgi:hypothetical protein